MDRRVGIHSPVILEMIVDSLVPGQTSRLQAWALHHGLALYKKVGTNGMSCLRKNVLPILFWGQGPL